MLSAVKVSKRTAAPVESEAPILETSVGSKRTRVQNALLEER